MAVKWDDSKAVAERSAITKMVGAREITAIGAKRVGPAGRITGPRRPQAVAPAAVALAAEEAAGEVDGVEPMRGAGLN